jgi:type VI secretion system secreted protein VgrG
MSGQPSVPVGKTPAQPTRTAQPTKHVVPIKLEIEEPAPKTDYKVDNGDRNTDPSMPKLKLKAKVTVQGQEVSIGAVRWEFHLTGTYPYRTGLTSVSHRAYNFAAGNVETKPGEEKEFQLLPADVIGGNLVVKASYTGGPDVGGATVTQTVAGCRVLGQRVDIDESQAYIIAQAGTLSWVFLRLFAYETRGANQLQQFSNGLPWIGAPAGVGIVQRDVEDDKWSRVFREEGGTTTTAPNRYFPSIFWNWRACVREGISFFNSEKLSTGQRNIRLLREHNPKLPAAPEGVVYRAAIRAYNGGFEYHCADGLHYQTPNDPGEYSYNVVRWTQPPQAANYPVPAEALAEIWPANPEPPRR